MWGFLRLGECCACILSCSFEDFTKESLSETSQRKKKRLIQLALLSNAPGRRQTVFGTWKVVGKNKLEEVLTTWERSRLLEAFPILYDSKSSTLLGLVASLWAQMLDLSWCSSHEGQSFAEVRRGLYEVQSKCFHSVNFLIKDAECGSRCSAEACSKVSGWGVE